MGITDPTPDRAPSWLGGALDYIVRNPVAGLRAPIRGAPRATWSLVPLLVLTALAIGLPAGLLSPRWPEWWMVIVVPPVVLVVPSLAEEFLYRGVLLPRSLLSGGPLVRFGAVTAATAVFVAVHPIPPLLGVTGNDIFLDPRMLVIVAVLGYVAGYAYLRSGSLWAPVLIHWLTVVVWNLFFRVW